MGRRQKERFLVRLTSILKRLRSSSSPLSFCCWLLLPHFVLGLSDNLFAGWFGCSAMSSQVVIAVVFTCWLMDGLIFHPPHVRCTTPLSLSFFLIALDPPYVSIIFSCSVELELRFVTDELRLYSLFLEVCCCLLLPDIPNEVSCFELNLLSVENCLRYGAAWLQSIRAAVRTAPSSAKLADCSRSSTRRTSTRPNRKSSKWSTAPESVSNSNRSSSSGSNGSPRLRPPTQWRRPRSIHLPTATAAAASINRHNNKSSEISWRSANFACSPTNCGNATNESESSVYFFVESFCRFVFAFAVWTTRFIILDGHGGLDCYIGLFFWSGCNIYDDVRTERRCIYGRACTSGLQQMKGRRCYR